MASCDPLLDNLKQVAAVVETTCGAGGTFTSADFKLRISALSVDTDMSPTEDDTLTSSLSPRPVTMGEKKATVKVASKLVGSGTAANAPECDVYLRGCGYAPVVVMKASIGAVTGGPFIPGEIITQATSNATGRVMAACADGDSKIFFQVVSGTWDGTHGITGGTSAATATLSTVPAASGHAYHPVASASAETIALKCEEDGFTKNVLGAMGSASITSESSGTAKIEFTFNGKKDTYGDAAMTAGVTYYDTVYPTFADARAVLDRGLTAEFTPVVRNVSVDFQAESVLRKDANDSSGLLATKITKRTPQIVLTAEAMLAADFDVYSKMEDCDAVTLGFRWKAPDNTVWVWGTNGQVVGNPEGAADGMRTMDLTLRMNGISGNDELWIVFLDE